MEEKNVPNNILAFLVVVFLIFTMWANIEIARSAFITGSVTEGTGSIRVCVNMPPTISYSCALTAYINHAYTCDIDAVRESSESIAFYDYTDLFDINASTGEISFTPSSAQTGSHLINITVRDNTTCSNDFDSEIINLTISEAYCGDGTCSIWEHCSNCSQDCGACPVTPAPEVTPSAKPSGGGGGAGVAIFDIDFRYVDEKVVAVYAGDKISFTFNGVTAHFINIKEAGDGYISVTIDSGFAVTVPLKEIIDFDMNSDGAEDIRIHLMEIDENKKARMNVIEGRGSGAVGKEDQLPLKVEPESIKVLLKVGTFFDQPLKVKSLARYDFNVAVEPRDIMQFVEVPESKFVLYSGKIKDLTLRFTAAPEQQPGVYTGKIFVEATPSPGKADMATRIVPVLLEIESAELLFDASLEIPLDYKEVMPGQKVKALITIFNLKKVRPVEMSVDYIIKDMDGNMIAREKDALSVEEQVSYDRYMQIPENAKEGDYVFIVQTRYGESFSTASEKFYVGKSKDKRVAETQQIVEEAQKKYNVLLFAAIGVLIALGIFVSMHYRKRIGGIEKESREKIMRRIEELEGKYRKEYESSEEFLEAEEKRLGLDKLADFIKEHLEKGFSKDDIHQHLKKHGWQDHHIHHAMKKASKKKLEDEIDNLRGMLR